MEFLSILPNLSIGVISVLALVYVTRQFIDHLKAQHKDHMLEVKEREHAMRSLENEVRKEIMGQLSLNTNAMSRVVEHLNRADAIQK